LLEHRPRAGQTATSIGVGTPPPDDFGECGECGLLGDGVEWPLCPLGVLWADPAKLGETSAKVASRTMAMVVVFTVLSSKAAVCSGSTTALLKLLG
jgi:hypothetical protein